MSDVQSRPEPEDDSPVVTTPAPIGAIAPAPATVSIDVPAQHQSLLERAAAVLEHAEGWVVDNVEAGIKQLETMLGIDNATHDAGDSNNP